MTGNDILVELRIHLLRGKKCDECDKPFKSGEAIDADIKCSDGVYPDPEVSFTHQKCPDKTATQGDQA